MMRVAASKRLDAGRGLGCPVNSADHFEQFFVLATVGAGLLLVGAMNLALGGRRGGRAALRAPLSLAVCGVALAALAALTRNALAVQSAVGMAGALVAVALVGSGWVHRRAAALGAWLRTPGARWGAVAVCGLATVIGAVAWFEYADQECLNRETHDLELALGRQPTRPAERARAATDRGTQVVLKEPTDPRAPESLASPEEKFLHSARLDDQVIRVAKPSDVSNCHGWVFTGGKFLLSGDDVDLILKENGYTETHEPHPGDVVIYRQGGAVSHTALVRYVTEGQPVLAESKWGTLGVFLHPTDKSPYGTDYAFYRSPRRGHLLAGLGGSGSNPGTSAGSAE